MQRTAQNYRAYDQSQRSSRVTADVVYRLGRVPKPVDIKTTIGTMPRRQRGRGRRSQYGGAYELDDIMGNDLIKIAKAEGVTGGNKLERVRALKEAGVTFDQARDILQRTPGVTKAAQKREEQGVSRTTTGELNEARTNLKGRLDVAADDTVNPPEPEALAADADTREVRDDAPATVETGSEPVKPARTESLKDRAPPLSQRSSTPPRSATPPRKGTKRSSAVDLRTPGYNTPASTTSGENFDSARQEQQPAESPPDADLAPTVSDPETLDALDRVATSTQYSNRLLTTMSTETQRQLETLTKETRKLVLNDPRMDADEVSTVVERIKENPDVAGLVQAGLVRPEQLKDEAYVLSLKSALATRKDDGRPASLRGRVRRSAAPVFERSVPSRRTSGLKYFKPAMHVRPSIFAPA
jgi:hypothetical protein